MDPMSIAQIANPFIQTVFIMVMGLGYFFTIRNLRSQVQEMKPASYRRRLRAPELSRSSTFRPGAYHRRQAPDHRHRGLREPAHRKPRRAKRRAWARKEHHV